MKKAITQQYGSVENIQLVEAPIPSLTQKEVLIKVKAAGLNPKDVFIRKGRFKRITGNNFPLGIGFDVAGVIEDPHNSLYQKGDKVFGMLNGWQGRCCAEYVNLKEDELYRLPDNVSFEDAAGIPLAGQTALQAIRDQGKFTEGQSILINGASGGVGTLAIQIAKAMGGTVTTITSSKNLDFCQSLGADRALSYEEIKVSELSPSYDLFFDVFGNFSFEKVAPILKPKGRYVTTVPKPAIFKELIFNLFRGKKAKLVRVHSNKQDLKWLSEKLEAGNIKPVTDKVFAFDDIRAAQKHIESKRSKGKVILRLA